MKPKTTFSISRIYSRNFGGAMHPSPSPRPSPLGRGRIARRVLEKPAAGLAKPAPKNGNQPIRRSLSPRERARVRGKETFK
jgi:hypothetical protein